MAEEREAESQVGGGDRGPQIQDGGERARPGRGERRPADAEARRENDGPDAGKEPEIEGHARRANEPAPDAENADPKAREARRENDGPDAGEEPEIEGHRKLQ